MRYENIGKNLKIYRKKIGLTQKELGEKVFKSEISIRKYESGTINIPPSTLSNIATVLGVSLNTLLGVDADKYFSENFNNASENMIAEKTLEIAQEYKALGESWHDAVINIENKPIYLLNAILNYLENTEEYYSSIFVNILNDSDNEMPYFTNAQINDIVKKVTELVKYEIYKIENKND